jgi:ribosomal protein S17E
MSDPPIRLPKPRNQRSCCVRTVLTSAFGAIIAPAFFSVWTSWKAAFDECGKNESDLRDDYLQLSMEIYAREANIADVLEQSKTIAELRTSLQHPYYENSKYKDKSLMELTDDFQRNKDQLKIVNEDQTSKKLENEISDKVSKLPRHAELGDDITFGDVPPTYKNTDINDLKVIMRA